MKIYTELQHNSTGYVPSYFLDAGLNNMIYRAYKNLKFSTLISIVCNAYIQGYHYYFKMQQKIQFGMIPLWIQYKLNFFYYYLLLNISNAIGSIAAIRFEIKANSLKQNYLNKLLHLPCF